MASKKPIVALLTGPTPEFQELQPSDTLEGAIPVGGSTGQVLKKNSATNYDTSWQADAGGVTGPGSSVDNRLARFNGTLGDAIDQALVAVDDAGAMTGVASIAVSGTVDGRDVSADGAALDAHVAAASPHSGHEVTSAKGAASGYAPLDAGSKVPIANVPILPQSNLATDSVGAAQIIAGAVGDAELRDSAGLSVVGRSANSTGDPADIVAAADGDVLRRSGTTVGFGQVATLGLADGAVTDAKLRDSAALSVVGRAANSSGDPADIAAASDFHVLRRSGTALGFGEVQAGGLADDAVTNAKLANAAPGTLKGRGSLETATGDPQDLASLEVRRIGNFLPASGSSVVRRGSKTARLVGSRILPISCTKPWVAGTATLGAILDTHGTGKNLYPYVAFSAIDALGHPHMDHDRLHSSSGPVLVTNASGVSVAALGGGLARFSRTSGSWLTDNYQVGKIVRPMGWTNAATNSRWEVQVTPTAADLTVYDLDNKITTETAAAGKEVRGTTGNASGMNGYEDGLFVPAGALAADERVEFLAVGWMENSGVGGNVDAFLEFAFEINPVAGNYAGAYLVRTTTGELGATWTGKLRAWWRATFTRLSSPSEYLLAWELAVQGVSSQRGAALIAGPDSRSVDLTLAPRFRVDRIPNWSTFNGTYQAATTLKAGVDRYMARAVR